MHKTVTNSVGIFLFNSGLENQFREPQSNGYCRLTVNDSIVPNTNLCKAQKINKRIWEKLILGSGRSSVEGKLQLNSIILFWENLMESRGARFTRPQDFKELNMSGAHTQTTLFLGRENFCIEQ